MSEISVLIKIFVQFSVKDTEGQHILYHCLHATKRHQLCLELALRYGAIVHEIVSSYSQRYIYFWTPGRWPNGSYKISPVHRSVCPGFFSESRL